jgi:hypothetical protein
MHDLQFHWWNVSGNFTPVWFEFQSETAVDDFYRVDRARAEGATRSRPPSFTARYALIFHAFSTGNKWFWMILWKMIQVLNGTMAFAVFKRKSQTDTRVAGQGEMMYRCSSGDMQ